MNESNGFIKLHRRILKWEWYQEANVFRVFLHLMLKANHSPARWQGIEIQAGQLVTSYRHIADELKLSPDTVHRAVKKLVSTGEIEICPNAKNTIVTLKNYYLYQDSRTLPERNPNDLRTLPEQKPNQTRINKNNKNKKNNKNNKNISADFINSVISDFNSVCISLPKVEMVEYRHGSLICSAVSIIGEMSFRELFQKVEQSDFLSGRSESSKNWKCSFEWILRPENLSKILAGNYDNKQSKQQERTYNAEDLFI